MHKVFRILKAQLSFLVLLNSLPAFSFDVEPLFNTPGFHGDATTTIEDRLIEMIRDAREGSKIRVALYHISRANLAQELVIASHRGVDVQIVLDGGTAHEIEENGSPLNILAYGFSGYSEGLKCAEDEVCLKLCKGPLAAPLSILKLKKNHDLGNACRGLIANHNKFFLFSDLNDGNSHVVAQTSANMADGQLKMYNDLLLIKNNPDFFEDFLNYWQKLKGDQTALFKKSHPTISDESGKLKSYFFPRLVSKDPVLSLLKKVNCKLPNSSIKASQSAFTRGGVAREMARLQAEGCDLQVITRVDPVQKSPGKKVIRSLRSEDLVILPYRGQEEKDRSENSIHTKIVLINASIDNSSEKVPVVLTGSHNLDLFSLRTNDEVLIEVRDQSVYEAYDAFLERILQDARDAGICI
ncbi:phospholipase D-like domain-containing protein [Pseudobdellovibrio exovorus]|uniref:phospholipase D n=1 Tax=Pseudobdellovibrio exovorus JSS TaxID=1184267 RepID=M4V8E9_9BACT|nr:phospholipase D-like domain-containing protein [Pseudobdellovibrio exovorus]AGH94735.1 hypothetical protein A11Q_515 [Pseudobdellovibrio exovorus JSS]